MIWVGSYWWAREAAADLNPSHIISIMDPGAIYQIPAGPGLISHIKIGAHDVVMDQNGLSAAYTAPSPQHAGQIIEFAQSWDRRGNIIVHCTAGVSRSTATALVILATTSPGLEIPIARLLRERAPWAAPNLRIVGLADELLGRRGALVRALSSMGPAEIRSAPAPIMLPNDFGF